MSHRETLPFDAPLTAYAEQADALLAALRAGDRRAEERFRWEHPRFRDRPLSDVQGAALRPSDARIVVAGTYAFDAWDELEAYVATVSDDGPVRRFELAVDAVVAGDTGYLRTALRDDPDLARARSTRRHHSTLLHYVAANGVEDMRQKTPANAVEVAIVLLDAGAEVDALSDAYGGDCTTMTLLVSSAHPARAGVQVALVELLLDRGADSDGRRSALDSTLVTALSFGYVDVAEVLARRGGPLDRLPAAAGMGRVDEAARLLEAADEADRHAALALATMHGRADVVRLLLQSGESPDRYNPPLFHAHATPLHQAVAGGHADVVRLLVDSGARLDFRDRIWEGTPLDWAVHLEQNAIADYLRDRQAAT